jgi:cell division septum initiation protein DivIVA
MRGYHPEDVDQFLERVAAGIEVLQDRLRQAIERAQRAEQAATEAGGNDDALRRTLVLAQRTADLAVQEGREQAAAIVAAAEQHFQTKLSEAEQRVQTMITEAEHRATSALADAERRANSMVTEAEQNARRGHEDALIEVRAELARLEVTRQRILTDIDAMTRWVAEHRGALRSALEEALSRVEQISISPPPAAGPPYSGAGQAAPVPAAATAGATASPTRGVEGLSAWAPPAPLVAAAPVAAPVAPAPPASPPPASPEAAPAHVAVPNVAAREAPEREAVPWRPPGPDGGGDDEGGDADPYFAELRRAISDRDPLGPAESGRPTGPAGDGDS